MDTEIDMELDTCTDNMEKLLLALRTRDRFGFVWEDPKYTLFLQIPLK